MRVLVVDSMREQGPLKSNGRMILVVDDERYIVDLLTDLLDDEGYQVISAFDGQTALEKVEREIPDLVLTDIMMPKLDGLSLLALIRERHGDLPVVLMSAAVTPLTLEAPYISKPFDLDDLLDLVDSQFNDRLGASS